MKPPFFDSSTSLTELVSFLATQQESILRNWRIACDQDPLLSNVAILSKREFDNSIPNVLTIFYQRLLGQPEEGKIAQLAIVHGL